MRRTDPRLHRAGMIAFGMLLAAGVPALATITYSCNPNIDATQPGTCSFLNTTIANIYSSTFTNANANIYIQYGTTGLGESDTVTNFVTYTQYQTALSADLTDANDHTAFNDSVPASEPATFGSDGVALTDANAAALGISATVGMDSSQTIGCTLGTSGCYNGVITISSSQPLWYRSLSSGAQTGGQYDFFSVVEHETDEILGTASCVFGCTFNIGTEMNPIMVNALSPVDLYRYSSNGSRSFGANDNVECPTIDAGNACFSIDGTHFLIQYNNVNDGNDGGDWLSGCPSHPQVQDGVACPGASVDINTDSGYEIEALDVVGFTLGSQPTPEPGTFVLVGTALLGVGLWRRRVQRRRKR